MDDSLFKKFTETKKLNPFELEYIKTLRVIQDNVIYAIGIRQDLCEEENLLSKSYFGQYGPIESIRINKNNVFTVKKDKKKYCRAYITYKHSLSSSLAILSINLKKCAGLSKLDASFSATKLCKFFVKGKPCLVENCHFMHSLNNIEQVIDEKSNVSKTLKLDALENFVVLNGVKNYIDLQMIEQFVMGENFNDGNENLNGQESNNIGEEEFLALVQDLESARDKGIKRPTDKAPEIPDEDIRFPSYKIGLRYLKYLEKQPLKPNPGPRG
jgi:hypothetical protein